MNTETLPAETPNPTEEHSQPDSSQPEPHHPGDWQYIKVAIFLAVLTALEVFTYFESVHRLGDIALYVILTVLMFLKFGYVIAWFMHLKFDTPTFRRIFAFSLTLALIVYLGMLTSFRIWS